MIMESCRQAYNVILILLYSNIGSDNGLAPARRQAIIWTNVGMFYWHIYVSLGLNELTVLVESELFYPPWYTLIKYNCAK